MMSAKTLYRGQLPPQQESSSWLGYTIIAIAIIALGGGAYLLWQQYQTPGAKNAMDPLAGAAGSSAGASTPEPTVIDKVKNAVSTAVKNATSSKFPLATGSRGAEVTNVQKYLNVRYGAGLDEDGIWGSKTNGAIAAKEHTTSVSMAEYNKMMSWLNTFPHDFSEKPSIANSGVKSETSQTLA